MPHALPSMLHSLPRMPSFLLLPLFGAKGNRNWCMSLRTRVLYFLQTLKTSWRESVHHLIISPCFRVQQNPETFLKPQISLHGWLGLKRKLKYYRMVPDLLLEFSGFPLRLAQDPGCGKHELPEEGRQTGSLFLLSAKVCVEWGRWTRELVMGWGSGGWQFECRRS